jgi:DNA-binding winged helix-turn-helix (wHTH) protein
MKEPRPARRYRFGVFEADATTGELRRQGIRVKLNAQPFQVLCMLLERPGELLTREQISSELWPDGTFVDFDHGVNSAINRIREALKDTASNPRFVETLARRGYRFVAPVDRIADGPSAPADSESSSPEALPLPSSPTAEESLTPTGHASIGESRFLASPADLPKIPHRVVLTLFILLQLMYIAFYVGALANLGEIEDLVSLLSKASLVLNVIIVTAAILIPVRAFVLCAVLFQAPGFRQKFLKLWPYLLALDELWALSPFLLMHHINFGLALACIVLLVYSPFAQRALILMGAGGME